MCYTCAMDALNKIGKTRGGMGWHEAGRRVLDTIFPPKCVGCGARGAWLCPACLRSVEPLRLPVCAVCRHPVENAAAHACRPAGAALLTVSAVGVYAGPLRSAIHALKYEGRHAVASALAPLLAERVGPLVVAGDVLVAIPLHPTRQRERGYNQSAVVAAELARLLPLETAPTALRRTRATADQVALSGEQRAANVRGAFTARVEGVRDRRVWLLDDVYTTGATMRAAALALRTAGAREIRGAVVAMTAR